MSRRIRVLILGGNGFIGSHIVDLCVQHGYQITVVDNLSSGKISNLTNAINEANRSQLTIIKRDIRDKNYLESLGSADYVFHLAARASVQGSLAYPIEFHDTNVNGTLNILNYCLKHSAKLIFSSTSAVYAQRSRPIPFYEASLLDPLSPYALQKLHAEQYIQMFHRLYGLRFAILRYSNVYGERQSTDGAYSGVVATFLEQRQKNFHLEISGNGEQRRDMIYVKDVAVANLMAMDWLGIFNIASEKSYSINDIARFVGGKRRHIEARDGEMLNNLMDIGLAKSLGWRPKIDLKEWIQLQL